MDWHDLLAKISWPEFAANLVTSLIVAFATAAAIAHLALKNFYAEKWWERKSAAYFAIIEALHEFRAQAEAKFAQSQQTRAPSKTAEQELNARVQHSLALLRQETDLGSLVISSDALSATNKLMAELDASAKTNNTADHLKLKLAALDECLSTLRRLAREDLTRK